MQRQLLPLPSIKKAHIDSSNKNTVISGHLVREKKSNQQIVRHFNFNKVKQIETKMLCSLCWKFYKLWTTEKIGAIWGWGTSHYDTYIRRLLPFCAYFELIFCALLGRFFSEFWDAVSLYQPLLGVIRWELQILGESPNSVICHANSTGIKSVRVWYSSQVRVEVMSDF